MSGAPKRTTRLTSANAGSPTGHTSYGDGTPIVGRVKAQTKGQSPKGDES